MFEISRRKDYDLGRSIAEYYKPTAKPFEHFLEHYSGQMFSKSFSSLAENERNAVYYEVVLAAGRNNERISSIAPWLGRAGKVCLLASIAISVYNVYNAEDKVNAAGREGSNVLGGIAGGAAGGALAGLMCGPGAPLCSGIGIFVGGAVGGFLAVGGYDWLTSK